MHERSLEDLCRNLAIALNAGIAPLAFFSDKTYQVPLELAGPIRASLRAGKGFSESITNLRLFSPVQLARLKSGEAQGRLPATLERIAEGIEAARKSRRKQALAMAYPAFLFLCAGCILPVPLLVSSDPGTYLAVATPGPIIVLSAALLWFLWVPSLPQGHGARTLPQRIGAKLPLTGNAAKKSAEAEFFDVLADLLEDGKGAVDALEIALGTSSHPLYQGVAHTAADQLAAGATLQETLEATTILSPRGLTSVALGEKSGTLPEMLRRHATVVRGEAKRVRLAILVGMTVLAFVVVTAIIMLGIAAGANAYFETIDGVLKEAR